MENSRANGKIDISAITLLDWQLYCLNDNAARVDVSKLSADISILSFRCDAKSETSSAAKIDAAIRDIESVLHTLNYSN